MSAAAMKPDADFEIDLHRHSVRLLSLEDVEAVQRLFEECRDYFRLVEGRGPLPDAAEQEFGSVPPGRSLEDKFMYGVFHEREGLVGLLEGLREYPDEATWWIGLLLLAPKARGQGVGHVVVHEFGSYVWMNGGRSIALGVVEDNRRALEFWKKLGFVLVRKTGPRQFGNKTQVVNVLRYTL